MSFVDALIRCSFMAGCKLCDDGADVAAAAESKASTPDVGVCGGFTESPAVAL